MKALLLFLSTATLFAVEKPNIILIMADDLGYGDLGAFGNQTIKTPHIDSIASQGAKLTDFHTNGVVCSPTRAALLTGRYQQRSGITGVITARNNRDDGLALEEKTFAEVLSQAGYATALFGKWHLGYEPKFNPTKQGFDEFKGFVSGNVDYQRHIDQAGFRDWWRQAERMDEPGYLTDLITGYTLDFIDRHPDQPFCIYLAHGAPHYPLQSRKTPGFRTEGNTKANIPVEDPKGIYKEMIEIMDEGIGRILDKLREQKRIDNTFVIFCSDNGPSSTGSAGPLRGRKGQIWEGGHRVPACMMWPRHIPARQTIIDTMMIMDLFPTFMRAAGLDGSNDPVLDGVSLLPTLTKGTPMPERVLFWDIGNQWAVRKGKWKLIGNKTDTQLYDLHQDLGETTNIGNENNERKRELVDAYRTWKAQIAQ
jgi:arylsulfatase A